MHGRLRGDPRQGENWAGTYEIVEIIVLGYTNVAIPAADQAESAPKSAKKRESWEWHVSCCAFGAKRKETVVDQENRGDHP
jgi:invasion protein IalB